MGYLSVIVLIPPSRPSFSARPRAGWTRFWRAITNPQAVAALKLTLGVSLAVVAINAVAGTTIAWVLVRDRFRAKSFVNALIDLPFALPTIVAGLTLLALYGTERALGVNIAYTRTAIVFALLFVTLPFVVRTVQPVLLELDAEMEEAARSLGAGLLGVFAGSLPEPAARDSLGYRAGFRPRRGRVRRRRPDLREPALPHRGRVGLHLRPDRERQRHRGRGCLGRAAHDLARRALRDRRPSPLGHEARRPMARVALRPSPRSPIWPRSSQHRSRSSSGARSSRTSTRRGRPRRRRRRCTRSG